MNGKQILVLDINSWERKGEDGSKRVYNKLLIIKKDYHDHLISDSSSVKSDVAAQYKGAGVYDADFDFFYDKDGKCIPYITGLKFVKGVEF